ncbi:hypothetical protein CRD_00767 [Raphidiopsis brookii D9]|nr:hypothetical protein CRD_00767 [Raphidiopsis brookii D9]
MGDFGIDLTSTHVFKPLMPLGVEHIKSIKIDKTMLTRENFFEAESFLPGA